MTSTPKQQDGDDGGVAPANGARSSLEQTVLGVAPAPIVPVAPPSQPEATSQRAQPEPPPPIEATPAAPAASATAGGAAVPIVVTAPVIVVAGHGAATPGRRELPESRAPETVPIPLVRPSAPIEVAAPPRPVGTQQPAPVRTSPIDSTLPVGAIPRPSPSSAAPSSPSPNPGVQRTALSDDYLREARQAALEAIARGGASEPGAASTAASSAPPAVAPLASVGVAPDDRTGAAGHGTHGLDDAPASFGTRPSIVATPLPREESDTGNAGDSVPVRTTRGFEPVPVLRAPLSESLSGSFGPVAEVGGHRNGPPSTARARAALPAQRSGDAVLRWLLLAAVALVSVASVMVGQRVWQRYRGEGSRPLATAAAASIEDPSDDSAASTARALMPSRSAPEAAAPGRAQVVSVTGGHPGDPATPGSAGPEAQLAATAGRHVIAGNYADALPLYQQLERAYPENTVYIAMSRLLEKKVGTASDTRTVAPAPAKPVKK